MTRDHRETRVSSRLTGHLGATPRDRPQDGPGCHGIRALLLRCSGASAQQKAPKPHAFAQAACVCRESPAFSAIACGFAARARDPHAPPAVPHERGRARMPWHPGPSSFVGHGGRRVRVARTRRETARDRRERRGFATNACGLGKRVRFRRFLLRAGPRAAKKKGPDAMASRPVLRSVARGRAEMTGESRTDARFAVITRHLGERRSSRQRARSDSYMPSATIASTRSTWRSALSSDHSLS